MEPMTRRSIAAAVAAGLLLLTAAACGDEDGSRPDITLPDITRPSTTTTDAGAAGSSTSTTEGSATTEEPDPTTTSEGDVTTTTEEVTTTTAPTTTTTAEVTTTTAPSTTAPGATDEDAAPPEATEPNEEDGTPWWWLVAVLAVLGLIAFLLWRRAHAGPPWAEQATRYAGEVDTAGRSVLLGPGLTQDLWTTALASSNEVRARADDLLDHAPSTAARQAVSEAVEALRQAEVQATAARSGVGGSGDRDLVTAELAAAVERLRAAAAPAMPTTP